MLTLHGYNLLSCRSVINYICYISTLYMLCMGIRVSIHIFPSSSKIYVVSCIHSIYNLQSSLKRVYRHMRLYFEQIQFLSISVANSKLQWRHDISSKSVKCPGNYKISANTLWAKLCIYEQKFSFCIELAIQLYFM